MMNSNYKLFIFDKFTYNENSNILYLYYKIDEFDFVEEINFNPNGKSLRILSNEEKKSLNLAFTYLHLVAGISYYKALLPKEIQINTIQLNLEQKKFFDDLYLYGLGEFAYRNNLFLNGKISFPYSDNVKNTSIDLNLSNTSIIPIGGGKDSLVTLEMVRNSGEKICTFAVNPTGPIISCIEKINLENISITRKISENLLHINSDLNKYNAYNGHVPITSIIAFISVAAGILYNCNSTIISNERSANVGNINHDGFLVNHQWSKSFMAENMINNFIQKYIISSFNYFSLLRPIYEIHIAKLFSKINIYHNIFSSCNRNFKIIKNDNQKLWCCDCDKCRFVFLILSPFMKKTEIVDIFGKNIFEDKDQLNGFLELTGFLNHKPFECVGEIEESIVAFYLLSKTEYSDDFIVKNINEKIFNKYSMEELKQMKKKYFDVELNNTLLNEKYKEIFINYIDKNE